MKNNICKEKKEKRILKDKEYKTYKVEKMNGYVLKG